MDFTWGIFLSKNKINQTNVLELKVIPYILINHLHDLLLRGFDNHDAYSLLVVVVTFSHKEHATWKFKKQIL